MLVFYLCHRSKIVQTRGNIFLSSFRQQIYNSSHTSPSSHLPTELCCYKNFKESLNDEFPRTITSFQSLKNGLDYSPYTALIHLIYSRLFGLNTSSYSHVTREFSWPPPCLRHVIYGNAPLHSGFSRAHDGMDKVLYAGWPFERCIWTGGCIWWVGKFKDSTCQIGNSLRQNVNKVAIHCQESVNSCLLTHSLPCHPSTISLQIERRLTLDTSPEIQRSSIQSFALANEKDISIIELRDLAYLPFRSQQELSNLEKQWNKPSSPSPEIGSVNATPPQSKDFVHLSGQTFSINLFITRYVIKEYCRLINNWHLIHIDSQYCRKVEGYRDIVVPGALSITVVCELLELWTSLLCLGDSDTNYSTLNYLLDKLMHTSHCVRLVYLDYRLISPLYAEECVSISARLSQQAKQHEYVEREYVRYFKRNPPLIPQLLDSDYFYKWKFWARNQYNQLILRGIAVLIASPSGGCYTQVS